MFTDPRFSWIYFSKEPKMDRIQRDVCASVREEIESLPQEICDQRPPAVLEEEPVHFGVNLIVDRSNHLNQPSDKPS